MARFKLFFGKIGAAPQSLLPGLVTDTDTFFAPTVAPGAVTIAPALVTDTDVFYAPSIAQTVLPAIVTDTDVFYAPDVAQVLLAGLVTDTDTFFAPAITTGAVAVEPGLIDSDDLFYSPSIVGGAITLFPDRVIDTDVIYAPTASFPGAQVTPSLYVDPFESFYGATVSRGLAAGLVTDTDTFFAPSVAGGQVSILPPLFVSTDVIYVPAVQRQNSQGNGGGGGGGGGNVPKDIKYATAITMAQSGLITAIGFTANSAVTVNTRMAIYANSGGNPGALLGQSAAKSSVALGSNLYPLLVPVSVLAAQTIWIALQSDGNNFQWFLVTSPNGSRFNNDLFSDGISDPFGAASNDNKKAPIFAVFLESANATVTVPKIDSDDLIYAPSISVSKTLTTSAVISDDSIWPPEVVSTYELYHFDPVTDADEIFTPTVEPGTITLEPGLVIDDDAFISPFVGQSAPPDHDVFSAVFVDEDLIYTAEVTPVGGDTLAPIVEDEDVIEPPVVSNYYEIFIGDFPIDEDVIPTPEVIAGTIELLPELVIDQDVPFEPPLVVTESPGQTLEPGLVVDDDTFLSPTGQRPSRHGHAAILGSSTRSATILGQRDDTVTISGGD